MDNVKFKNAFSLVTYVQKTYPYQYVGDNIFIPCPFHEDETPSCSITETGFFCFGCGHSGDSIRFLMDSLQLSYRNVINGNFTEYFDAEHVSSRATHKKKRRRPNYNLVEYYYQELMGHPEKQEYLYDRHYDQLSIQDALLGWGLPKGFAKFNKPRYTIPVFDTTGELLTIRYRIDPECDDGQEPKYLSHPKAPIGLYNSHLIDKYKELIIVGSELDAGVLYYRYGIAAVSPPGENVFKPEWGQLFTGKNVLIILDNDYAGYMGAVKIYNAIESPGTRAKIYKWDHTLPKKYDVGDMIKDHGIYSLRSAMTDYDVMAYAN